MLINVGKEAKKDPVLTFECVSHINHKIKLWQRIKLQQSRDLYILLAFYVTSKLFWIFHIYIYNFFLLHCVTQNSSVTVNIKFSGHLNIKLHTGLFCSSKKGWLVCVATLSLAWLWTLQPKTMSRPESRRPVGWGHSMAGSIAINIYSAGRVVLESSGLESR